MDLKGDFFVLETCGGVVNERGFFLTAGDTTASCCGEASLENITSSWPTLDSVHPCI